MAGETPTVYRRTEQTAWTELFAMREKALPHLEKARQEKLIGKALEAKGVVKGAATSLGSLSAHQDALRELLNISQLEIAAVADAIDTEISVAKADGTKCERCWHWETDVGQNTEHPTICGRCAGNVDGPGETRRYV